MKSTLQIRTMTPTQLIEYFGSQEVKVIDTNIKGVVMINGEFFRITKMTKNQRRNKRAKLRRK